MDDLLHDVSWVLWLRSPAATVFFSAFTYLGYSGFYLLFLPIGYWTVNKKVFTRAAILLLANAIVNAYLKDFFHDPRPPPFYALDNRVLESYGLPSGHAQASVALWFWLAYELKKPAAYAGAFVLVFLIIFSRLYLGVHDVEDVLAGAILGVLSIYLYRWMLLATFDFRKSINPIAEIGIVFGAQLALFAAWPVSGVPSGTLSIAGFMLGWFAGTRIDRRYIRYQKSGQRWRIAAGALIGAASILGLLLIDKRRETATAAVSIPLLWAYAKALLLGLNVTVFIPIILQMLKLGTRSDIDNPR
jgi:membrane-associated phospholipid phosphatase